MSDEKITEVRVRSEHLHEVSQTAPWAYLFGVLLSGLALMVLLMALLGAAPPS
jgi:hypothetical protein